MRVTRCLFEESQRLADWIKHDRLSIVDCVALALPNPPQCPFLPSSRVSCALLVRRSPSFAYDFVVMVLLFLTTFLFFLFCSLISPLVSVARIDRLNKESLPRVLVVGREASRVCRLCDLGAVDLLQGVDTLAFAVESVHEMHAGGIVIVRSLRGQETLVVGSGIFGGANGGKIREDAPGGCAEAFAEL